MNITRHEYRGYVFTIEYEAEEPAHQVAFPDFPEIITGGTTLGKAFDHACEALDSHLESMQKLNMKIPKPKHRLLLKTA